MPQKTKELRDAREQQDPNQMEKDTAASHPVGTAATTYRKKDARDTLFTYSDGSTLSRDDLLSLALAASHASLETAFWTASIINLFMVIYEPIFMHTCSTFETRA